MFERNENMDKPGKSEAELLHGLGRWLSWYQACLESVRTGIWILRSCGNCWGGQLHNANTRKRERRVIPELGNLPI